MNLEQLRKQAKELARAARAGDAQALERLGGREPILARAQLVLAREQGYPSWAALVAADAASVEAFVLAATGRQRTRAEAMLTARPEIAEGPYGRLVLGRGWAGDPCTPGGPRGWAPLLYVCHSCFPSATLARELLDRGADPNSSFENDYGAMSALYGAAGVAHDPELTRVLLEAGADPNDGESLYHATEARDVDCLRLLLEHGATIGGTNALAHALDHDAPDHEAGEHARLLLEAGADPNDGSLVAHAVRRGRGTATVRMLAAFGADLDRPGGETWRGDVRLRTPYQHAVLRGRDDVAELLAELGASTDVSGDDVAVSALSRGERAPAPLSGPFDHDEQEVVVLAALRGHYDAVVDAVGPDFRGVVGGSPEGSLLHHAAWIGSPELVRALLARAADPRGGGGETGTPLAWAAHGSQHHLLEGRDYVAVAELLVEAGAAVEDAMLELAEGPLYRWLESRVG